MGLFGKKNVKEEGLKQDLTAEAVRPGMVFIIHLLMEEPCAMPEANLMCEVMQKHLGEVQNFGDNTEVAGFAPLKYKVHYEADHKDVPPQLMIMKCIENTEKIMDDIARSQLWDCPDSEEILNKCKYQVIATDMMAAGLDYKDRAEMLVDYIEALVEMFPTCKAVVFDNSKKMFTREQICNCQMPKESKFIYYAVNVRFFNIQGTGDMLVDTLGMSTLFLPDLQYHFHDMDPNWVVNHAYNVLSYIYDENNPLKDNDHVDGVKDGHMSQEVQWTIQYESALIQPVREVVDFNMGEYAAGTR